MAEVVGVAFHCEAVDTHGYLALFGGIPGAVGVVVAGFGQYLVGNEVFAGAVALHNGAHHVLRYIFVVGQQLFGVFRKAVAAVAERRVVVVGPNAGIEAYSVYNLLGVKPLHLCIGVQFVEV